MITKLSARTWVLMGFGISLLAVVINVFILSGINDRIKEADGEISKLNASLVNQATELTRADMKGDFFTILHHLSKLSPDKEEQKAAGDSSIAVLQEFLKKYYAAVNDIPVNEMLKAQSEDLNGQLKAGEKYTAAYALQQEGRTAEAERLIQEAEEIEKQSAQAKSELGKKLDQSAELPDVDNLGSKSNYEIMMAIIPLWKSSNEQYIASTQKKETRIKELQGKKASLSGWQSMFSFLAVSLQLFGLMFVLTKDLVKDTKERRDKAEKAARAAEEEARQAEIEAAAAKARATQANLEADKAEAAAEERIEEAQEAVEAAEAKADAAQNNAGKRLAEVGMK